MMATEATSVNTVNTSSSSVELIYPSKDLSKNYDNVSNECGSKYGQSKHDLDLETKTNSASVSVCGGSDTENLKVENSKSEYEEKGHTRTTSIVKRPTSFKPVSVNKKFLAAKGSTSTSTSKLVDKSLPGSNSAQAIPLAGGSSARPRLVAKSGPSLHTTPRAAVTPNGSRAGAVPDPNAVWNKNRPAPPPEPKRYSDEELKQRYGIHLARRLESDNAGKQANWADIDDDDDDWAPNTMEWADGTKVTLPQVDEVLTTTPTPIADPVVESITRKENDPEVAKSRSSVPTKILAPSQTIRPTAFSGRAGLVLKGATEKPDIISKVPGPPAVVKSPWAPLPPIEKTAPVTEVSQLQQSRQTRPGQKDINSPNTIQPTSAKEIAADDFRRKWRDSPNGSRELYNAQSGRYEPANDKRRGSLRNEARPQQPSVLQRSHPENPAEPSPAFQAHRAAGQDGHSRRRNSSNVSAGSEKAIRKISRRNIPPPPVSPAARKGSIVVVGDEPGSPSNSSQTTQQQPYQRCQQSQTWQPHASPIKGYISPQLRNGQVLPSVTTETINNVQPIVYEDVFEVQKKAMQLKRELAIARRREQEEKETLEREERIRIKLASMGPSPENLKKESARHEKSVVPPAQIRGPTKLTSNETNLTESDSVETSLPLSDQKEEKPITTNVESNLAGKKQTSDLRPKSNHSAQGVSTQTQLSQDTPSSQSWHNNNSERFKPWAPAPSQQTSSRNVWGSPTNDRTLGNGTFNPELSRLPEISPHPSPIGPLTSDRSRPLGQTQEYSNRPAPIGPPNRRFGQESSQESEIRSAVANSGWGSLPNKIAEEDARQAKRQEIEMSRIRDLREKGLLVEPQPPVVHDTWRQVSMKKNGTRSKIESNNTTIHNEPEKPWKKPDELSSRRSLECQDISQRRPLDTIGSQQEFSDAWKVSHINAPPIRDSRFFPNNKDIRMVAEDVNFSLGRPESPSPPPPTQPGHPAYEGNIARPHVSLPRPPPIVKLPPLNVLAPIGPPKPASFAAVVATPALSTVNRNAPRIQSRDPQTWDVRREKPVAGNWQDKINSLIGRKCSPSKSNLPTVDSSIKKPLGIPHQHRSATVLLPSLVPGDSAIGIGSVQTKPASEVCFEEQEMGSLPPIKLPLKPPTAAWNLAPSPKPLPKKFMLLQSTSREAITFPTLTTNNGVSFTIKFPGQIEPKNVLIHATRYQFSPRRTGARTGTNLRYSSSSHQRVRGRDSSGTFPPSNPDHIAATSDLNLASRGRSRRQSSSWKRNSVTTVQS